MAEERPAADEAELLRLAAGGDEPAAAELYDRHAPSVLRMVAVMLSDLQAGEDVVQDAFIYVINHAEAFDPGRSSLRTWLCRVALSLAHNELRRRRRKPTVSLETPVVSDGEALPMSELISGPVERAEGRSTSEALRYVNRLDEDDRQILILRYVEGLPPREIAALLGIKVKAASMRLWRATKELQEMIRREEADSS